MSSKTKGEKKRPGMRTEATKRRLEMYKTRAIRDKRGKVVYEAFRSRDVSHNAMIQPDRRWFVGTRTVDQTELSNFREAMSKHNEDPRSLLLKPGKIPFSLLTDVKQLKNSNILEVESFENTFGKNAQRKRPKLSFTDMEEFAANGAQAELNYNPENDRNIAKNTDFNQPLCRSQIYLKGQSARIWGELHKVIDSSDVLIEVLDARNPMGTRVFHIEKHIKKNCPGKHLLLLLNKSDLIPTWSLKRWISILSKEYPTVAFHASIKKPFGKGSLIQILRQFQSLQRNKPQISVGFVGYPNVGKSSIINTLRRKKVCASAPVPGYTKVWQYITLFKKILLVDCPGVVYPNEDSESDIVLKGVVRIENLTDAPDHIEEILSRVRKQHIIKTYGILKWEDHIDFLSQLARKYGQLLPGNEPNIDGTAKIVLRDWLYGKIPYFVPPPFDDGDNELEKSKENPSKAAIESENDEICNDEIFNENSTNQSSKIVAPSQILKNLVVREEFLDQRGPDDDVDKHVKTIDPEVIPSDDEGSSEVSGDSSDSDDNVIDWDNVYNDVYGSEDEFELDSLAKSKSNSKEKNECSKIEIEQQMDDPVYDKLDTVDEVNLTCVRNAEKKQKLAEKKQKLAEKKQKPAKNDLDYLDSTICKNNHNFESIDHSDDLNDCDSSHLDNDKVCKTFRKKSKSDFQSNNNNNSDEFKIDLPTDELTTIKMTSHIMNGPILRNKRKKKIPNEASKDRVIINSGFGSYKKKQGKKKNRLKSKNSSFEMVKKY